MENWGVGYYIMLKDKHYFNFKNWDVFYQLYKTEPFLYFIENFMILNMPFLTSILFHIRYQILKILKKR